MSEQETIFAVATGHGAAGIAVVRMSGSNSWTAIEKLTKKPAPKPRYLARRWIYEANGSVLDDCMVVVFKAGASFTGEQSAEIHCHGSRAVLSAVLNELSKIPNLREALPGEFTRRAFDAGLMDLNQVEGLGDLIHADTEFQRRQALRIMSGAATDQIAVWRRSLVRARALVEVTIDWADEEVPEDVSPEVLQLLKSIDQDIENEISKFHRTERLRDGYEVAIVGAPNVGKSSLINAIAGREVAITSEIAGTTRDVIETRCDLAGLPVTFLDTAGIRETNDTIEKAGVDIARRRAQSANLRIFLRSFDEPPIETEFLQDMDILAWSKCDLMQSDAAVQISAKTGQGIDELINMVRERLLEETQHLGVFGHRRQFDAMQRCGHSVRQGITDADLVDAEVLAEHLRVALMELDSLAGRSGVEDVLGEVFSSFCLGK